MTTLLGLAIIYVFVHALIILANTKKEARTSYQNGVLIAALVALVLEIIGLSN